jgi:hypothetical protein
MLQIEMLSTSTFYPLGQPKQVGSDDIQQYALAENECYRDDGIADQVLLKQTGQRFVQPPQDDEKIDDDQDGIKAKFNQSHVYLSPAFKVPQEIPGPLKDNPVSCLTMPLCFLRNWETE